MRLNLPSNFGYFKLRTIIDLIIYKELGLLKVVYTCFIMSLEIQNHNKISRLTNGKKTSKKDIKGEEKAVLDQAGAGRHLVVFQMAKFTQIKRAERGFGQPNSLRTPIPILNYPPSACLLAFLYCLQTFSNVVA